MSISDLASVTAVIFLAELGDKSQLAAFAFGARYSAKAVLLGLIIAFGCINAFSVAIGAALGEIIPPNVSQLAAGLLFIAVGIWNWFDSEEQEEEEEDRSDAPRRLFKRSVPLMVASSLIIAELGDKTMFATAAFATQHPPFLVWVGATTGEVAASSLGMLGGRSLAKRLHANTIRTISTMLFIVVGTTLIIATAL